jgi:hypothetical protein
MTTRPRVSFISRRPLILENAREEGSCGHSSVFYRRDIFTSVSMATQKKEVSKIRIVAETTHRTDGFEVVSSPYYSKLM